MSVPVCNGPSALFITICDGHSGLSGTICEVEEKGTGSKFIPLYFNTPFRLCFTKMIHSYLVIISICALDMKTKYCLLCNISILCV